MTTTFQQLVEHPRSASGDSLGAFCTEVRAVALNGGSLRPTIQAAAAGLGETIPSDGGFLVSSPLSAEIWQKVYEVGELLRRCTEIPTVQRAGGVKTVTIDETSRVAGSRFGGLQLTWIEEGAEIPASKPKFALVNQEFKKAATLVYASDELAEDSELLNATLMQVLPQAFAAKFEDSIINGTGAGQPLGILNSSARIVVGKEVGQAANTVNWTNVKKIWSRLWTRSKRGDLSTRSTVWLLDNSVDTELYSLTQEVGTGGSSVFQPATGAPDQPYATLFGRPIIPIEFAKALGTEGDLILCDLSQYLIARKAMAADLSIHVRWVNSESCFRFVFRVDGMPGWSSAITPANSGATQSPIVVLATRA